MKEMILLLQHIATAFDQ